MAISSGERNPQKSLLLLADRFPGILESIVDEIKCDLKPDTDSLILNALSRCVQCFSDCVVDVDPWQKTLHMNGVTVQVIHPQHVEQLADEIALIFLRR